MSAEARTLELIDDAVRRATAPLKQAVEALSARLAAVEESGGPTVAEPARRAAGGRTAKARAKDYDSRTATDEEAK